MKKLTLTLALIAGLAPAVNAQQDMSKAQAAAVLLVGAGYCHTRFDMFTTDELRRFASNSTKWLVNNGVDASEFNEAIDWARRVVFNRPPDEDACADIGNTLNE